MTRYVAALKQSSSTPVAHEQIVEWERENQALPQEYKDFMSNYNGGFIFPDHFEHNVEDEDDWVEADSPTVLNHVYSWQDFVEKQSFKGNEWRTHFIAVAEDITGSLILLSSRDDDFGHVYYWWRNNDNWDEDDGPIPLGHLASSFKDFLFTTLFENEEGPTGRWGVKSFFDGASALNF